MIITNYICSQRRFCIYLPTNVVPSLETEELVISPNVRISQVYVDEAFIPLMDHSTSTFGNAVFILSVVNTPLVSVSKNQKIKNRRNALSKCKFVKLQIERE